jgi:hypothetical protein
VKITLWLYFWLLLLEGVLRKWVVPEYSNIIFIIRDPLVIITYVFAWHEGVFPRRPGMVVIWLLAVLSLIFAVESNSPFVVTLFGLRTNYLHLPLIFVMAQTLDREDVRRFGRWFLLTSLPVTALMLAQFESPPGALINAGVGGAEMGQIRGALGRIRPPGPFSFISGVVSYFALVSAFVFHGWLQRRAYKWILLVPATAALAIAIPISISRSLLLAVLIVAAFGLAVSARDLRRAPAYLGPVIAAFAVATFLADTVYVRAFVVRWQESVTAGGAGFSENVTGRIFSVFTQPFDVAADAPLLGHGIGMGTVAGARLATGKYTFLLAESELARLVLELGPVLGFAFIVWRLWLALTLVMQSWRRFVATKDALGWLITGAVFLSVLSGQWGPSTQLGYAVFGAGLALAALNDPKPAGDDPANQEPDEEPAADA